MMFGEYNEYFVMKFILCIFKYFLDLKEKHTVKNTVKKVPWILNSSLKHQAAWGQQSYVRSFSISIYSRISSSHLSESLHLP